ALLEAYRAHFARTNPLVDHPTRRILRFIILEEEEMIQWGAAALQALLADDETRAQAEAWEAHLRAYLAAAGGIASIPVVDAEPSNAENGHDTATAARPSPSHPLTPSPLLPFSPSLPAPRATAPL